MMTPAPGASNILGISAKSLHAGRKASRGAASPEAAVNAKSARYTLQRRAQALMFEHGKAPHEQRRVCWCQRTVKNRGESISVYRQATGGGARFSGLSTCGSVWHCPVCAAKITETRRRELDLALTAWVRQGGIAQLLTLTFPHEADWPLADLLERFGKALTSFKNSRAYKRVMEGAGRAGSIRSLETTWGENGWHPHTHDLVFIKADLSDADVDALAGAWVKALMKPAVGLATSANLNDMLKPASKGRGCIALNLQDGSYAAEYIAKFGHDSAWGAAAEMTKPHAKVGALGQVGGEQHFTPFQLLAWAENGDERAAALFREFGQAFEGKRMLSWSPGLRKALNLAEQELSDEDIAAHEDPAPTEEYVGLVNLDQLRVLLSRNRMGDFLAYVALYCTNPAAGQGDIDDYIADIATMPATHGSQYRKRRDFAGGLEVLH
jgi:hypothetical protein